MASSKQTAASLATCASCKCDVGKEAGKVPFFVDDGGNDGEKAKTEAFCPHCFVYVRGPKEPERFRTGTFIPLFCRACRLKSVSVGVDHCQQCQSPHVELILPEKGVA